ncbi:MAG: alpha/beta hydrolase [Rhodobacteraceae bacterium]|nr:alpha/beta hydrolase [Paracoccaceae bacterium]
MAASLALAAALTAAAAGGVHWRASARERAAEAAFPPEGRLLDVGGQRVHAVVMGEGPDLVLLHGLSANARDFTFSLAPRLAERYRVIVFDRPGLGHSQPLPPGADGIFDQARVLRDAAAELGAERPIVLGQSYGGAVALAWAVEFPGSAAALVSVAGPSQGCSPRSSRRRRRRRAMPIMSARRWHCAARRCGSTPAIGRSCCPRSRPWSRATPA